MGARILDGHAVAAATLARVRDEVAEYAAGRGRVPVLVVVGESDCVPAGERVGMTVHRVELPASEPALVAAIRELSLDPSVDGVLVQHPLPAPLDERVVYDAVDPAQDVGGVTGASFAALALGTPGPVPATPGAIMALLDAHDVRLAYRQAVVIGGGATLGRPMGMLLLARDATVTYCHSHTIDLAAHIAEADVVIAAAGQPGLVPGRWVKQGAVVVDTGDPGDVEHAAAAERASLITPVPNGLGPLAVATVLAQTVRAARESSRGRVRQMT